MLKIVWLFVSGPWCEMSSWMNMKLVRGWHCRRAKLIGPVYGSTPELTRHVQLDHYLLHLRRWPNYMPTFAPNWYSLTRIIAVFTYTCFVIEWQLLSSSVEGKSQGHTLGQLYMLVLWEGLLDKFITQCALGVEHYWTHVRNWLISYLRREAHHSASVERQLSHRVLMYIRARLASKSHVTLNPHLVNDVVFTPPGARPLGKHE